MTILENAADIWIEDFGEEIEVYASQGQSTGSDGIWHQSDGWSGSATTYTARVLEEPSNDILEAAGFSEDTDLMLWVTSSGINEGDKITYSSRDWIVDQVVIRRIQGRAYKWSVSARSAEQ